MGKLILSQKKTAPASIEEYLKFEQFGRAPNFKSLKGLEERNLIAGSHKIFLFLARRKSNLCECTRTYIGKIPAFLRNHMKKYKYRRKSTGRRCCFGNRVYSFSCHASYFALGRFEEQDDLHQDDLKKRIKPSYSSKGIV